MTNIQDALLKLALFAMGLIATAYVPLALYYLFGFVRRGHLGWQLIKQSLLRLLAILFVLLMMSSAFGFFMDAMRGAAALPPYWLGAGTICGFFGGIVLFGIGVWRGRRQSTETPTALPHV